MMDRDSHTKQLILEGKTYKDISVIIGITRGAVAGAVYRLRARNELTHELKEPTRMVTFVPDKPSVRRPAEEPVEASAEMLDEPVEVAVEAIEVPAPVRGVGLMDLRMNDCRYVIGRHEEQHYFCGEPRRDVGTSYCAEHHKIVWVKRVTASPEAIAKREAAALRKKYFRREDAA